MISFLFLSRHHGTVVLDTRSRAHEGADTRDPRKVVEVAETGPGPAHRREDSNTKAVQDQEQNSKDHFQQKGSLRCGNLHADYAQRKGCPNHSDGNAETDAVTKARCRAVQAGSTVGIERVG